MRRQSKWHWALVYVSAEVNRERAFFALKFANRQPNIRVGSIHRAHVGCRPRLAKSPHQWLKYVALGACLHSKIGH